MLVTGQCQGYGWGSEHLALTQSRLPGTVHFREHRGLNTKAAQTAEGRGPLTCCRSPVETLRTRVGMIMKQAL